MLRVEMTPNLLGFKISGDYDALDKLYDAIWDLTPPNPGFPEDSRGAGSSWTSGEQRMGSRLLALCFDLRHAYQGDRNLAVEPARLTQEEASWHGVPLVKGFLVYSVEVLYPEAMYEFAAISYLAVKRMNAMRGSNDPDLEVPHLLSTSVALAQYYQSLVLQAVGAKATSGRLARIKGYLTQDPATLPMLYDQWVDVINADYIHMTKKRRAESLSTVVRDIVEWDKNDQCLGMMTDIQSFSESHGCPVEGVRLQCEAAYDVELVW